MAQQEIPFEQAESAVKNNDKVRMAFVEEFYRVPWDSIHAFDLVINTGKISSDLSASWVIDVAKTSVTSLETDKPTTSSIVVDRILADAVSETLKCSQTHR
jgi:cytidylate kinase